jgi:hypothetical protein
MDLSGRVMDVAMENSDLSSGTQILSLPLSGIDPGTYFLELKVNEHQSTKLLLIH